MDVLVEFRAGRMQYQDKLLRADHRKGLIRVTKDDQGLTHFQWLLRENAEIAKDVIIFPYESKFEKLKRPGARVFVLNFKDEPERNMFFWAQEADAADDDTHAAAVDQAINMHLEDDEMRASAENTGATNETTVENTSQPAELTATRGPGGGAIQADLLASVLSNLVGSNAPPLHERQAVASSPTLNVILKPEYVVPLLQAPDVVEKLLPFLPAEQRSKESLSEIISSPQFRHQLALFSHALMSGEISFSQFGLEGQGVGVLDFLQAIQNLVDQHK